MELQMCTNRRQHELCPTAHANPELQRKEMRSQGLSLRGQAESPKQAQDDAADGDGPHVALVVLWQGNTARGVEQRPRHQLARVKWESGFCKGKLASEARTTAKRAQTLKRVTSSELQ